MGIYIDWGIGGDGKKKIEQAHVGDLGSECDNHGDEKTRSGSASKHPNKQAAKLAAGGLKRLYLLEYLS